MKLLTRTIIVLCVGNLTAAIPVSAMMAASKDKTLTISGSVGLPGVTMTGLPGDPTSTLDGSYSATVPSGFSGRVTPIKEGCRFEPSSREYIALTANFADHHYAPSIITYTISGNVGVGGVRMQGLPGNIVTDQTGRYSVAVPYGWSGTVKPAKEGHIFDPPNISYARVVIDHANGNYEAMAIPGGSDLYGSFGSYRSRGGRRGSGPGMDMMYEPSNSRLGGRRSSGYRPAIHSGGRKVLVIPAEEVNAKEFSETIEDMHVMSHILDEQFKETRRIQGFFTDFGAFFGRDSRNTEASYLQGYGVLFLMEVNFAFSPPPKRRAQDPNETPEAVDSTWQKARQQVLSPGASPSVDEQDSARDYDNQMVEELKKELVEALKHASNIRNIASDEWVILTVIGGQRQSSMGFGGGIPMGGRMSRSQSSTRGGASAGGMGGGMGGYSSSSGYTTSSYSGAGGIMYGGMEGYTGGMYGEMAPPNKTAFSSSTVLTIRAKKSDVDDFAKGALDFDQFQKKVTILMY